MPNSIAKELEINGIARLSELVDPPTLRDMQTAFASRLTRQRWNDQEGYERTERFRLMVQDLLTLAQGFVDVALHPAVQEAVRAYVGDKVELVEAKGWQSLPTHRDFHGWHGDSWYDQDTVKDRIPRELKLGFYLTEVKSGFFQYLKGSHGKQAPRGYKKHEAESLCLDQKVEMPGPAGTAFLFDTSGIHRQGIPILEPRQAFFLTYHEPDVPLQKEDIDYYRYHPLLLNAAFLGKLTPEDQRLLGFGNKTNYLPAFQRRPEHRGFQAFMRLTYTTKLYVGEFRRRVAGKLKKWIGK